MLNKQSKKKRVTSPGSAVECTQMKAAKAGGFPTKMETIEFDLFSLNVRQITSINCFVAILDIIQKKQISL